MPPLLYLNVWVADAVTPLESFRGSKLDSLNGRQLA